MNTICNFCNKNFKNIYVLNTHIKSAKYCLVKQGKIEKPLDDFQCKKCNKKLSSKRNLEKHDCKIKKEFKCDICDKNLCTKYYLKNHKEKCINKNNINKCEYCDIIFPTKNSLIIHQSKCVSKFEHQINELQNNHKIEISELQNNHKIEISELQNKIENIALKAVNKPTKQINNNNNNNTMNNTLNINNVDFLSYMTKDRIKEVFDKNFTIKMLYDCSSNEALADFTIDNFLSGDDKPIYICSDKQRQNFYFLDKDKNRIDDKNAKILTNLIITYGLNSIEKSYNNHIQNIKEQPIKLNDSFKTVMSLKKDNKEYISHLTNKLPKTIKERYILDEIRNNLLIENTPSNKNDIEYVMEETDSDDDLDKNEYSTEDTICNMMEISRYKLSLLKKWYIETGEIKVSDDFKCTDKNIEKYVKYLKS